MRIALQWLHFQAIIKILSPLSIVVRKPLKTYLRWDEKGEVPYNSYVLMKKLIEIGVHTYTGMLKYCMKDRGEDHFEVVHNNVIDVELVIGLEEYVKYGTPFAKNKIVLTSKNLLK